MRTPQEVPDCTIDQRRMGLHGVVASILDPNHGCIRRIVVEVVQLTGQAVRVLHSPKNQCWNVDPERSCGGRVGCNGKENWGGGWGFCLCRRKEGGREPDWVSSAVKV